MQNELSIIFVIILAAAAIFYFLNKKFSDLKKPQDNDTLIEWIKSTQSSLDQINKNLNDSLSKSSSNMVKTLQENSKQLNDRLDKAASVIKDVGKEVGQMSEIGRSMQELQDFLKSPKLRGNIGEHILKELLGQMLPKSSFHLQYAFKNGTTVDAAIKTEAGIIPIDSKFPLEGYRKMSGAKTEAEKSLLKNNLSQTSKNILTVSARNTS